MFEETFPGVVGFLVANIRSGTEREMKTRSSEGGRESWPTIIWDGCGEVEDMHPPSGTKWAEEFDIEGKPRGGR